MRHLAALVAVTLLLSCSVTPVADEGDGKTLYGLDDRVELREASQPLRNAGASVVALFGSDALIPVADGRWRLRFGPSGAERGWCPDERFSRQPRGALCSGFLIAPDRIATSAHCVRPPDDPYAAGLDCDEARFVFGFGLGADGEPPAVLTPEQVYRCAAVIDGEGSPNGADWRVVRLDRAVSDRLPLPVYAGDTPLARGTALTVIGHPIGLPAKVAPGGAVTDDTTVDHFVADLDTYEGNSGSPVLATLAARPVVVGLLARGETDFDATPEGCERSRRCDAERCGGEHVTRSTRFASWASATVRP